MVQYKIDNNMFIRYIYILLLTSIMWQAILSKIMSESLLSLYPVFVKKINLPLDIQMWSRFFTYVVISAFFIDYAYVYTHLFTPYGIALMLITIIHVYSSYSGFQLLDSGIAYTIFYTYPILILLLSGKMNVTVILLSICTLFGVYLLTSEKNKSAEKETTESSSHGPDTEKNAKKYRGFFWIGIAALTEALIYFIVKKLKTTNNWNHLFISYGVGSVGFTLYNIYSKRILETSYTQTNTLLSILINSIIGLFGYLLRFYSISNLDTFVYATLSYLGVVMAYIYGIVLNGETVSLQKIIGTLFILGPSLYSVG
jgi:drug/metabolite transporter (DMT)-like permease